MFWKMNIPSPHIEVLLNKEDVSLHELMDEEDVLQECKVQNKKLIEYLLRPDVMEELVTLTTVEPSEDIDERTRYKYPNIACELLTCDVPALNERLAGDETLLRKLFSFLESDSPLNPLLASFFSKTLGLLVARKSEQNWYSYQFTCLQVLEFLKSKENCVSLLLKHLGTSAIMDLLLKLMTHVKGSDMKQIIQNWLDSQNVVAGLLDLLNPSVDTARHCNASQLLCDFIKMSRENSIASSDQSESDPILSSLESFDMITKLLQHILGDEKCETSIIGGISVLLALLDVGKESPNQDSNKSYGNSPSESINKIHDLSGEVIKTIIQAVLPYLKNFHNLLLAPPQKSPIKTTFGILDPPLGSTRLHVIKLLSALVATNNAEINKEIARLGTVEVILDLFFKYTWNNFLHTQVEQFLAYAINSELHLTGSEEPQEYVLLHNIFIKCQLLQRILNAWEENDTLQSKSGGLRQGYMGHLIKIANNIVQQSENSTLPNFLKENVPEIVEKWNTFIGETLAETNKTQQICLGGVHPLQSTSEENNVEYRDIRFPQASSLQMYSPWIHQDDFEETPRLNDEQENRSQLFEQFCSQRMSAIINCDEENTWDCIVTNVSRRDDRIWNENETVGNNSSDDDEDLDDDEKPNTDSGVQMEIDPVDPWASTELTTKVAPITEDVTNPWSSNSNSSEAVATGDQGWADFGSLESFANFEANFDADEQNNSSEKSTDSKMCVSAANIVDLPQNVEVTSASSPSGSSTLFRSNLMSDGNANPNKVCLDEQDLLVDNYRNKTDDPQTEVPTDFPTNGPL